MADLDAARFETIASDLINALMNSLDDQIGDDAAVDLEAGVLTIRLDDGGAYVINKHGPNRQIWVSSPVSGATHFDWKDGAWIDSRGGREMLAMLASELASATDTDVCLADVG